tara:strand:+ start:1811 stop:2194 length:384 start_codon:yes stop_codon:yes gene_type:complete
MSIFVIGVNELTNKTLEEKSKYGDLDYDGDGTVSDKELETHHKIMEARQEEIRLANRDAKDDQQRKMVWVSLLSVCVAVALILTPLISEARLNIIIPFLQVWSITNLGVVATFMAVNVWGEKVKNGN